MRVWRDLLTFPRQFPAESRLADRRQRLVSTMGMKALIWHEHNVRLLDGVTESPWPRNSLSPWALPLPLASCEAHQRDHGCYPTLSLFLATRRSPPPISSPVAQAQDLAQQLPRFMLDSSGIKKKILRCPSFPPGSVHAGFVKISGQRRNWNLGPATCTRLRLSVLLSPASLALF